MIENANANASASASASACAHGVEVRAQTLETLFRPDDPGSVTGEVLT